MIHNKYRSALLDSVRNKDNGYKLSSFLIEYDLDGDAPFDIIKSFEQMYADGNFDLIARLAMKFLAENYNPHTTMIITSTNAEILGGIKSTGVIYDYIEEK